MTPRHTVLLVDDDTEITELLGEYLRRIGYEVLCAGNGQARRSVCWTWSAAPTTTCPSPSSPANWSPACKNLLENALRYGQQATVSVARREDGRLRVWVDDAGPGIAPQWLERVKQPFLRVEASRHRHHGGLGLGLAVADDVARRHGGQLRLSNRPEGGLRAKLELPALRRGADPPSRHAG